MIDFETAALAAGIDRGHRIERHAFGVEQLNAVQDPPERRGATLVLAELVVDVLRTVDRDTQQEVVLLEETRPLARDEGAVGLQAVVDLLAAGILLLERHRPTVEVQSHHQRFAAVPDELHLRHVVGRDVVPHHLLQHLQAHPGLPAAVDLRLVEIVAIGAVEVAERPGGLHHDVERPRPGQLLRIRRQRIIAGTGAVNGQSGIHCFVVSCIGIFKCGSSGNCQIITFDFSVDNCLISYDFRICIAVIWFFDNGDSGYRH